MAGKIKKLVAVEGLRCLLMPFGHTATALLLKKLRPWTLALPLPRACSHLRPTDSPAFEEDEHFRSCKTSQEKNLEHT